MGGSQPHPSVSLGSGQDNGGQGNGPANGGVSMTALLPTPGAPAYTYPFGMSSSVFGQYSATVKGNFSLGPSITRSSIVGSATAAPTVVQTFGGYANRGLYSDASAGSSPPGSPLLSDNFVSNSGVSVAQCAGFCAAYKYFGVENGKCYDPVVHDEANYLKR